MSAHSGQGLEITVTPIPLIEAGGRPLKAKLGDKRMDELFSGILSFAAEQADAAYILTWTGGTNIPRGAAIGNRVIAWTQNGIAQAEDGQQIGVYSRVKDGVGPERQSEMVLLAFPEEVAAEPKE
ncbi:MAG TPA: hypothetical protein VIH90_01440 [Candidatus Saccharimonadales bacterium]